MSNSKPILRAAAFQRLLLRWFDQHGRKNLPWQHNKTAYRIWISEIMLQQTQVNTVIPYYERFMAEFSDLKTLAEAPEDTVLHYWSGLGYYHRARHLHRAAKQIIQEYQGQFPNEITALMDLPGIGRSTAGAICSIAFDKPAAILDGNVRRVLTRLHGIMEWPGEKSTEAALWSLADYFTPTKRSADYAQAIMDLGATLCTRGQPRCEQCPFATVCVAHEKHLEKSIPVAKPKKTLPIREATLLILQKDLEQVLLEKRPEKGVWRGLWSLPEIPGTATIADIQTLCRERFQLSINTMRFAERFRHTFSHYHLDITPVYIDFSRSKGKILENEHQIWYKLQQSQRIGLPQPIKLLLNQLENAL